MFEKCFCLRLKICNKIAKDATPIDFAYAVHTKIGNTAIGSEINGNKSELQSILRNGDINIITSKKFIASLDTNHKTGKQGLLLEILA